VRDARHAGRTDDVADQPPTDPRTEEQTL